MAIRKKKISEFPLAETLIGLFTIGVNSKNKSVKVSLEFLKTSADNADKAAKSANNAAAKANEAATSANNAADSANTAAENADSAADKAKKATQSANAAAENANTKAGAADRSASSANQAAGLASSQASNAEDKASKAENAANETAKTNEVALATIARLEELEESPVGQYKMIPTAMTLTYPKVITLRNPSALRIAYELFPTNTGRNVLFLSDDNAVSVLPNGSIVVRRTGISKVHAIPTENTEIYQTVEIKVVEPYMRKTAPSAIRLTGSGNIRFT